MHKATELLLDWYERDHVAYPWRLTQDPYRIWLSEILLQQTRISVALRYYNAILARFPTIRHLARATPESFSSSWSGIGYYRRAENMRDCARRIVSDYGGNFPQEISDLLNLPGIGPYTAGALRNLCFGLLTPAIDGNARRVLARLTNNRTPAQGAKFTEAIRTAFMAFGADAPAGPYLQSLMELGERICLPKPKCSVCPLMPHCEAHSTGSVDRVPRTQSKKQTETWHWYFLMLQRKNAFYFVQNPRRDFLKNAWLFPDLLTKKKMARSKLATEFSDRWKLNLSGVRVAAELSHAVTFRRIRAHVLIPTSFGVNSLGTWLTPDELKAYPTSSITRKILARITKTR